jgi:hypothetical protein
MQLERLSPQGNFIRFSAAAIVQQRHVPQAVKITRVGSVEPAEPVRVIHLTGNVEISVFNTALMLHASAQDDLKKEIVVTADEADYYVDTGEIRPRGHASIRFQ